MDGRKRARPQRRHRHLQISNTEVVPHSPIGDMDGIPVLVRADGRVDNDILHIVVIDG
jgi:hypothetical protein